MFLNESDIMDSVLFTEGKAFQKYEWNANTRGAVSRSVNQYIKGMNKDKLECLTSLDQADPVSKASIHKTISKKNYKTVSVSGKLVLIKTAIDKDGKTYLKSAQLLVNEIAEKHTVIKTLPFKNMLL